MPLFTTAYAGHGDTDEANIKAVLDNLLPEALGLVYIPRLPRRSPAGQAAQPGLRKTVTWLVSEVGEDGTIPVDDPIEALEQRHSTVGDTVVLVMVYDPDNEADVELAKAAHEKGIRVVDLCQAGDDILFEQPDDDPPFSTDDLDPVDVPADAPTGTTVTDEPAGPLQMVSNDARARAGQAIPPSGGITVTFAVQLGPDQVAQIADAIVAAMGRQAVSQISTDGTAAAHPGQAATTAPAESAPAKSGKAFYYDSDKGTYRPARGMARQTETKVTLTADEEAKARADGLFG